MAVTEVKQQSAIMQKLADMKKGGTSDTEIDRKEEAEAILKFSDSFTGSEIEKMSGSDALALILGTLEAYSFLQSNNFTEIKDMLQKMIDKCEHHVSITEKIKEFMSKQGTGNKLDILY